MNSETGTPIDVREILGFDPETGERYSPTPPRFSSLDDLKSHPEEWFALLSPEERVLYLARERNRMRQIPTHIRLFESLHRQQQNALRNSDRIEVEKWFDAKLEMFTPCDLVIPQERTIHKTSVRTLLQLVPPQEGGLLAIVNGIYGGSVPTYGRNGILQMIADYVRKPVVGKIVYGLSQDFLPKPH